LRIIIVIKKKKMLPINNPPPQTPTSPQKRRRTDDTPSPTPPNIPELSISDLDGVDAKEMFAQTSRGYGFTFDDVIMLPGSISFAVSDVNLNTRLTKGGISLKIPFVSSPMDTVTESRMAISMALEGGMGFIHGHWSIEAQCDEVRKVKRFESGFIRDPVCLKPTDLISDVDRVKNETGFTGIPITELGKAGSKLLGLVTSRDIDFMEDRTRKLSDVMTKRQDLVILREPCTLDEANAELRKRKKGRLPVVDAQDNLVALVSRKDLRKNQDWPNASKNRTTKQLLVGAAISIDDEDDIQLSSARARLEALVEAGVDVVAIEGDAVKQINLLKWSKERFPSLQVVCGNVATASQVRVLCENGADAIRVGVGVGSIATGQLVKAVGRAQMSAVFSASCVAKEFGVPVIADGGVANSGCAIKALALGANCVMMGSLLAGTEESPGVYYFENGMRVKSYRGMMSRDVLDKTQRAKKNGSLITGSGNSSSSSGGGSSSSTRLGGGSNSASDFVVAQGVSGAVVDKGSLHRFVPYQAQSIRHGLQDAGASSLDELHKMLFDGRLRFEVRSSAAQREGGIHDLYSYSR
jgi:IMP dehydrogenase